VPLVRIELIKGRSDEEIAAIGGAVQQALVATMNVPKHDRFQVVTEHDRTRFLYNDGYLGVMRTDGIVFIQVFLSKGRTTEQKQAFYALATRLLSEDAKVRPEDVAITLTENAREDWSFGRGVAQYVVLPKEEWK
jgi:phenylpyruvate tautomerase PptA (4-oxalocrotonate tautomerase family)